MIRLPGSLVLVLSLASPAFANQIQVGYPGSNYGPYQSGVGGEFTLNDVNGTVGGNDWLDLSGYSALTRALLIGARVVRRRTLHLRARVVGKLEIRRRSWC